MTHTTNEAVIEALESCIVVQDRGMSWLHFDQPKVREALALLKSSPVPDKESGSIRESMRKAAAYLHPPVPDEAEIERMAKNLFPPDEINDGCPWYGHRRAIEDTACRVALRYAYSHGATKPVDSEVLRAGNAMRAEPIMRRMLAQNDSTGEWDTSGDPEGLDVVNQQHRRLIEGWTWQEVWIFPAKSQAIPPEPTTPNT